MEIVESDQTKMIISKKYNYLFNKINGDFQRWGSSFNEDPKWSPYGPEIADIEISTICSNNCKFCYKSNTCFGTYMPFETFKQVFKKLPKTVTQIAFGIGDIDANPDMYTIMKYCRDHGVIPNVTINGSRMLDSDYQKLAGLCGAVSVSLYDFETCKNAVVTLGKQGLTQVNIHALLAEETFDKCMEIAKKSKTDKDLKKYLNAIVFLWLKPKGKHNTYTQISSEKHSELMEYLKSNNVKFGFDSCSAPMVYNYFPEQSEYIEPCESTLFSVYINVEGKAFPCSFAETYSGFEGTDIINCKNFIKDVWNGLEFSGFRNKLLKNTDCNGCRKCPIYKLWS